MAIKYWFKTADVHLFWFTHIYLVVEHLII